MIKIIAEAGCNWRTMEEAKQFIDESHKLGLFAVKFQIYNVDLILNHPQRDFLNQIRINEIRAKELLDHGEDVGIPVFFSVMYRAAFHWLRELDPPFYKIRYNDRFDEDILWYSLHSGKKVFISYGTYDVPFQNENIIPLFCIPKYPTTYWDYIEKLPEANQMHTFRGISDHSDSLRLLKEARKNNVEYFEKHVCLTKDCLESKWSCTFDELSEVLK